MTRNTYTLKDMFQGLIGAFDMIIFYIVLRSGITFLSPTEGLIITVAWLGILYYSFNKMKGYHFFQTAIVVFVMSAALCHVFRIATISEIIANPLGSPAALFMWLGLPPALIFDKKNINNVLKRYTINNI